MMIKKTLACSLLALTYLPVMAGNMGTIRSHQLTGIYAGAFGGYGVVSGAYKQDGNVAQGRLTLGMHAVNYNLLMLGAELGLQSGNSMRLHASPSVLLGGGGLPIQSTLKPLVDALVTVNYQFSPNSPLFVLLKGGIAYRQLELEDRSSGQDSLNKVNGEFQGGLGYQLTEQVLISAFYQGIYSSSDARVALNSIGDTTISQIPTQQAGFLGFEYSF